jgi:hypothetical protein
MNDFILSYAVLEFFCWPPHWDQYLTKMMEERLRKYKQEKKGVVKS